MSTDTDADEFFHNDETARAELTQILDHLKKRYVGCRVRLFPARPRFGERVGVITAVDIFAGEPWYGVSVFKKNRKGELTDEFFDQVTYHLREHLEILP